jgi:hypothetical protein
MKMFHQNKILFALLLCGCENLSPIDKSTDYNEKTQFHVTDNASLNCPAAPIEDHSEVVGIVIDLFHPYENPLYDMGKLKVESITDYHHDPRASYKPLKVGDEIYINFDLGARGQRPEFYLPVIKTGDKITGFLIGPRGGYMESEWIIRKYSLINGNF